MTNETRQSRTVGQRSCEIHRIPIIIICATHVLWKIYLCGQRVVADRRRGEWSGDTGWGRVVLWDGSPIWTSLVVEQKPSQSVSGMMWVP